GFGGGAETHRRPLVGLFLHAALMSAVKVLGMIIRSAVADGPKWWDAQSREQDPKTPVEQALMRGLATA
ncbi:MAG: hypothetical protein ACRET0_15980, partial [Steroidobacteraceae bacterium]